MTKGRTIEIAEARLVGILRRTLSDRVARLVMREIRGERVDLEEAARKAEDLASGPVDEVTRAAVRRLRRRHG